ncbi:hypothetical protein GQ55_3G273000 [Panicum hallii var. hallii]|uniref:DUF4220 domain-containing protein n=1 Tax=Panicum hallii var. hallii TaxID=1504633 RepID=A0A2T7EDX7_9POAL|nr:hypothetical protein GQ55_3G273000 [Panicum hallii var. hallii]
MRPIKMKGGEAGRGILMEKLSLAPAVEELWNAWEIHCLILISLFLQVVLFLAAGMRRRNTSHVLRTVLWLAYMTADVVAIFVLGHLAVHASTPRHQLMYFWAPFVLVHLGGQDTITAFSKQDNELWTRHLLNVVTQVAVAGYVVAKASWPDRRLRAAMVIMFLSGFFKYAERTWCLYFANPARLRSSTLHSLSMSLGTLEMVHDKRFIGGVCYPVTVDPKGDMSRILDVMLTGNIGAGREVYRGTGRLATPVDISSVDVPLNEVDCILAADHLPDLLHQKFKSNPNRCKAYEYVGAHLVYCYQYLYTKHPLRELLCNNYRRASSIFRWPTPTRRYIYLTLKNCPGILLLLYPLFHYVSTPVALVLFMAAEKGDRLHTSTTDITVTYVLLLGAIVLDVSSATIFIFSYVMRFNNLPTRILLVANYISSTLTRKQWCEELAQYSMIKSRLLGDRFLDITRIPITEDHKEFILDNLLCFGIAKEWNCTSSRGQLALQKRHQDHPDSALYRSTRSSVDFPTSVLIWHVATDMCYHLEDNCGTSSAVTKRKEMSRELSNYVMYLIFKCHVMLTSNSQLIHDRFHLEIRDILLPHREQVTNFGEKEAIKVIFEADKKEEIQDSKVQTPKDEEEPSAGKDSPADNPFQQLPQSAEEALYTPVLPRAREVAQELISINDGTVRWDLIAAVWSEFLYYTAVRCGGDFHYKHLSTGGEFVTHILVLMLFLGPFQPTLGSLAP